MDLTPSACYRAVLARDARHDGRFFTCVKTTGIYCRPICPARPPQLKNCIFVPTAAAAQAAGYRPCLRCPAGKLAEPGRLAGHVRHSFARLRLIETGALDDGGDLVSLAQRLNVGPRHLRRLFTRHIGAAPVTVAQTRRVLLAKQLIHQTNLPMSSVALASGFGSIRRFNETFQRMFKRPPGELRRRAARPEQSPEIALLLPYRPPYDWPVMLGFLRARAIPGVESVTADSYSRVIRLGDHVGSITVSHSPEQSGLIAQVRFPNLAHLPIIIARIRRMFDLAADAAAIAEALRADPVLVPLVLARPGLRVPGAWDGFEIAVRAILGQQITVKAATTIAAQLVAKIGEPITPSAEHPALTRAFPSPRRFTPSALASIGITKSRAAALAALAAATAADPALFDPGQNLTVFVARLCDLPGIGEWTAQYIAMRALGESDAFLAADIGLQRSLALANSGRRPTAAQLLARSHRWRPWRAYAVIHLWMHDSLAPTPTVEIPHALTA